MDKVYDWTVDYGNRRLLGFGAIMWHHEANKHTIHTDYAGAFDAMLEYAKEYGNARIRCEELGVDMKLSVEG